MPETVRDAFEMGAICGAIAEVLSMLISKVWDKICELFGKAKNAILKEGVSEAAVAQYGDEFGKMGTYVENPKIEVDWSQYAEHAAERIQQRGMTRELIDNIVDNGKVLSQNGGNKFVFITKEGVAVVSKEGKLITGWTYLDYDEVMVEIVIKLFGE